MSKKVLILNGSPRKTSDTMQLTRAFLKGMDASGEFETEIINIIEKNVKPCLGCFGCWHTDAGECLQRDDDMNEILAKYKEADIIIWSFPLYFYSLPSHIKAVLDRTLPLMRWEMTMESGKMIHLPLVDMTGKKFLVLCGYGFAGWEGNLTAVRAQCENSFPDPITVCVPETPLMHVEPAKPLAEMLLKKFEAAGREFATSCKLSEETIQSLETPMLPVEVYLKQANG